MYFSCFSCQGLGADVLDIANDVVASKELKYEPVSNFRLKQFSKKIENNLKTAEF